MQGLLPLYNADNMQEVADAFFNAYEALQVVIWEKIEGLEHPLRPKAERVCRFCGKGSMDVTFKKDAHRISQSLGNGYLLSDFECDECNLLFGTYENDLTTYFLPFLALQGIRGQEGTRKFKSSKVRFEDFEFEGIQMMRVSRINTDDDTIIADHETGKNSIKFTKGTYTPLKVYKAFLKMALSCISDEDAKLYRLAINTLLADAHDKGISQFAKLAVHSMPISFGHRPPVVFIYRKKDITAKIPTHVFVLHFANVYVQFFLPLHTGDIQLFYSEGVFDTLICPPIFAEPTAFCPPEYLPLDLSSTELLKAEGHTFNYDADPDILKNHGVVFDPATGETKPLENFSDTQQVLFVPKGLQLSKEATKRLMERLKLEKL